MKNIIFIGGGGHSLSCADILIQDKNLHLIGFIDHNKNALLTKDNYKWLGSDEVLEFLINKYKNVFIAMGHIRNPQNRIFFYEKSKQIGAIFPILQSQHSYVSPSSNIEEGTLIMHGAVINAKAHISKNCIINTNAVIEHGAQIGNHVHIAPNATILGDVRIEDECFIGAGTIIKEGATVKKGTFIRAGEVFV